MIWLLIVALMAIGMVLLFVEVTILPGFGVAGVSSVVFLVGGAAIAWWKYGAAWGTGSILLAGGICAGILFLAPRTRAGKGLVLDTALTTKPSEGLTALMGKTGKSLTPLRPSGAADIEGKRVDVVAEGELIDAGKSVKVVSIEGGRVVVVPVHAEKEASEKQAAAS